MKSKDKSLVAILIGVLIVCQILSFASLVNNVLLTVIMVIALIGIIYFSARNLKEKMKPALMWAAIGVITVSSLAIYGAYNLKKQKEFVKQGMIDRKK